MTVSELKSELKCRGQGALGIKTELQRRLTEHVSATGFKAPEYLGMALSPSSQKNIRFLCTSYELGR